MEVVVNPASGRLIVLLNGTAHMGCQSDFTCPGISHCRSQDEFSWIDGPNSSSTQCICPWYLATEGALCDEPTSRTWGLFVIASATSLISFTALLFTSGVALGSLRVCWRDRQGSATESGSDDRRARRKNRLGSSSTSSTAFKFTVVPMWLAPLTVFLYALQWQIRLIRIDDFMSGTDLTTGGPGKVTRLEILERISFVLSYLTFVVAMNNFSLLWMELLNGSSRTNSKGQSAIKYYRRFLLVLYVITFVAIMSYLVQGKYENIAYICSVGIIVTWTFYGLAWFRFQRVNKWLESLNQDLPSAVDDDDTRNQDGTSTSQIAARHMNAIRLLQKVRIVAFRVFLLTFLMLMCSLGYALSPSRPFENTQQFFGLFVFFFAAMDLLVVGWFMLVSASMKPRDDQPDRTQQAELLRNQPEDAEAQQKPAGVPRSEYGRVLDSNAKGSAVHSSAGDKLEDKPASERTKQAHGGVPSASSIL